MLYLWLLKSLNHWNFLFSFFGNFGWKLALCASKMFYFWIFWNEMKNKSKNAILKAPKIRAIQRCFRRNQRWFSADQRWMSLRCQPGPSQVVHRNASKKHWNAAIKLKKVKTQYWIENFLVVFNMSQHICEAYGHNIPKKGKGHPGIVWRLEEIVSKQ